MAYSPELYYYVKLTFTSKTDSTDTFNIYVGNRPAYDETTTEIIPALKNISGLSNSVNNHMPESSTGRITIDNTRGVFGFQKRFSDYLEKYTLINQDIIIYYVINDLNTKTVSGANTLITDRVSKVLIRNDEVYLYTRRDSVPTHDVTYIISPELWPNAPEKSRGKAIPLIFGDAVDVPLVEYKEDTNGKYFAYGTTFYTQFPNYGLIKQGGGSHSENGVYAKDHTGEYKQVASVGAYNTPYIGSATAGSSTATSLPVDVGGHAYKVDFEDGIIITSWFITLNKNASGPSEEQITIGIWTEHPSKQKPDQLISSGGTIVASDLATGWNDVTGVFDEPVVLAGGKTYYFGFYTDTQDNSGTPTNRIAYKKEASSTYTHKKFKLETGSAEANGRWKSNAQSPDDEYRMGFYGVEFQDLPDGSSSEENSSGLAISKLYMKVQADAVENLSLLDAIVNVNGIKDDNSGTITGTANKIITEPHYITKLLHYTWNGSAWVAGNFTSSQYSDSHTQLTDTTKNYYRRVDGATSSKQNAKQVLQSIMQESLCYLTQRYTLGQSTVWAWGNPVSSVADIYDYDILSISHSVEDVSSIVNVARGKFNKKLGTLSPFLVNIYEGNAQYYQYLEYRYNDGSIGQSYSANSEAIYGRNENARQVYNWIQGDLVALTNPSMQSILQGQLAINQAPIEIVELEIPFVKYSTLKMWDVVKLYTPDLPASSGTSPTALDLAYSGAEQTLTDVDNQMFVGRSYRAQIIGIGYDFSERDLIVKLKTRLLINKADPT